VMTHDIRLLAISEIKIGRRHRKDLGDLVALATSIDRGLLQPIGGSPEMELIWGYRRLLATRDILKRREILCRIVSVDSIVQGEFTENLHPAINHLFAAINLGRLQLAHMVARNVLSTAWGRRCP
jgi:hypothetical protein